MRPTHSEQLLRIGAGPMRSGNRKLNVEMTVRSSRRSSFASARRMRLRGVEKFVNWGNAHGVSLLKRRMARFESSDLFGFECAND